MTDLCGECKYLDLKDCRYGDRYYCNKQNKRVKLDDKACSYIQKGKVKNDGYQPSGCFITTVVCELLDYADDCEVLQVLRFFRDTVLKGNEAYYPLLQEYDQVGPVIADQIRNECDPRQLAMVLLQGFIIPCAIEIKAGNVERAIDIYVNMVTMLKTKYGLMGMTVDCNLDTPLEILGKGRARYYKESECF